MTIFFYKTFCDPQSCSHYHVYVLLSIAINCILLLLLPRPPIVPGKRFCVGRRMSSPAKEAIVNDEGVRSGHQQQKAEERRRQLNRRAQKAFRERRTEHMAHLETSIEQMNKELQSCQAARTMAVEELLMVKYKNSLLERLLLEKGIDVNRELNDPRPAKTRRARNSYDAPHTHISKKRRRRSYALSSSDRSLCHPSGLAWQAVPPTRPIISSTMSTVHPGERRSRIIGGYFGYSRYSPTRPGKLSPSSLPNLPCRTFGPRLTLCFRTRVPRL